MQRHSALSVCLLFAAFTSGAAQQTTTPGAAWSSKTPAEVNLDSTKLSQFQSSVGGRGCVVRHGYMAYTWGDPAARGDIASAAKPFYSHFLFKAVEEGRLASVDVKANVYETRLNSINASLGNKDRNITFRHFANQTSCYGVRENPGAAFDYNDWQMALFWDTLFLKVYGATTSTVDAAVFRPRLTNLLQCQDSPTMLAFGENDRAGRVAISVRDHARFGLLYLREGNWNGTQLLSTANARAAVRSPLSNSTPQTAGQAAEMIAGQRSIGSTALPDNQTDHYGSYSWLWWTNGVDRSGKRLMPDVPSDAYVASGHGGRRLLAVIPSLDLVCAWNESSITNWAGTNAALKNLVQSVVVPSGPLSGQIVVDPSTPRWLKVQGGGPFFLCGPGDPEDFLYRGTRNGDGTRSGDQLTLINKIKGTGANAIYLQAIRSHGGDGDATHNPFVSSDPAQGLDPELLSQWETWFTEMDNNGIVIYFIFYDDSARIWTGDAVGSAERSMIQGLVNRFEHHKNLIWCVAEEYGEAYTAARVKAIAAEIRAADDHDHVIAVHKNHGTGFSEFADDPNIDQFAVQYNVPSAPELHAGMVTAWNGAAGKFNLNMSEAAGHGTGAAARKKDWACAMGGAYVLRLGMDIASTPAADLQDCGRLASFMKSTTFNQMVPHDELKSAGTEYVLALPGDSYIAYASALTGNIGLKSMTAGTYAFKWFDCATGATVNQTGVNVGAGDQSWTRPSGIGVELALSLKRTGGTSNAPPTANPQSVTVPHNTPTAITLGYSDPDGPGPYAFAIGTPPAKGSLSGSGAARTYAPNSGASGADSFTWKVNDGLADSNIATVSLTIQAAGNSAPVAANQSFSTVQNAPVLMSLSYSDPDGPGPYAVTIVASPAHGSLSGTGNDRTYTPNAGYTGSDSFMWKVSDGLATSNTATVSLTVTASSAPFGNTTPSTYVWDVLAVGRTQYVDRTYTFSAVPSSVDGLPYLRTANDDKGSSGSSFLSFDLPGSAVVYVAHDTRFTSRPSWMSGFVDTGEVLLSGGGTFRLFSKTFPMGRVTLGGNTADGVAANSMYSVVVRLQSGGGPFTVTIDSVSTGRPYSLSVAQAGALYYIDRSYTITSIGSTMNGDALIRTANDDKSVSAATHLRFTVSGAAVVRVGYDRRAASFPAWLNDGTWTATSDSLAVSDAGASPLRIFSKSVPAGQVLLGGNLAGGAIGALSNYLVLVESSVSAKATSSLSADAWDHPGDTDGDGLHDSFETAHGTDPLQADSDGDGHPDESELDGSGRTLWNVQAAGGEGSGGRRGCGLTGSEALAAVILGEMLRRMRRSPTCRERAR